MKTLTPFPGLTISYSHRADGSFRNLSSIQQYLHIDQSIAFLQLEHGHQIVSLTQESTHTYIGDSILTNLANQMLTLVVGDCFPVLLFDPIHKAIALVHCGWKSLTQNILALTIEEMHNTFQSNPEEMMVWIGPGICRTCYVQQDEPEQLGNKGWQTAIVQHSDGRYLVDLVQFILLELQRASVKKPNIVWEHLCTYEEKKLFFSHRRATLTSDEDGRFFVTAVLE